MNHIDSFTLETTDRAGIPHVLSIAHVNGTVFYISVAITGITAHPVHCFFVQLPIKREPKL